MKNKIKRSKFGKIFKQALLDSKKSRETRITKSAVAEACGIHQPAITGWVQGKTEPTLFNLVKVADLLGCSTDYLLGRTEIKDSPVTIHGNQNAANIVNSTVEIDGGGESARKDAEIARLTRECERLSAECERRFRERG